MARRTLWNVPCTGHHRDGSPCRALSIRGGVRLRSHGGATRQARRLAAYRLWRAGIWERAGRDTAMRLGKFFKTGAAFWMNMQARFDLETAEDALAPQIKKIASYEAT